MSEDISMNEFPTRIIGYGIAQCRELSLVDVVPVFERWCSSLVFVTF